MSNINILVGSTLGGTEYVAETAQTLLEEAGHTIQIHFNPDIDSLDFSNKQIWLVCISTHGAGDYPENFKAFVDQITSSNSDFSAINYSVIGIGDSNYDSFCSAAINLDSLLNDKGANRFGEILKIDVVEYPIPEDRVADLIPLLIKDLKILSN